MYEGSLDAVRIDRQTKWGNPYKIGRDGDREQVIAKYEAYLLESPLYEQLGELRGKDLACWCAPPSGLAIDEVPRWCHGQVLGYYANLSPSDKNE